MKVNETKIVRANGGERHVIIAALPPRDDPGSTLVTRYQVSLFSAAGKPTPLVTWRTTLAGAEAAADRLLSTP